MILDAKMECLYLLDSEIIEMASVEDMDAIETD